MSSAICFNLDQSKILSSDNALKDITKPWFGLITNKRAIMAVESPSGLCGIREQGLESGPLG